MKHNLTSLEICGEINEQAIQCFFSTLLFQKYNKNTEQTFQGSKEDMFSMVLNISSCSFFFIFATVMCCSLAVEHVLKCSFYSSMYTPHTIQQSMNI